MKTYFFISCNFFKYYFDVISYVIYITFNMTSKINNKLQSNLVFSLLVQSFILFKGFLLI